MSKLSSDLSSVTVVGLDLAKHVFQVHCGFLDHRHLVGERP